MLKASLDEQLHAKRRVESVATRVTALEMDAAGQKGRSSLMGTLLVAPLASAPESWFLSSARSSASRSRHFSLRTRHPALSAIRLDLSLTPIGYERNGADCNAPADASWTSQEVQEAAACTRSTPPSSTAPPRPRASHSRSPTSTGCTVPVAGQGSATTTSSSSTAPSPPGARWGRSAPMCRATTRAPLASRTSAG